MYRHAQVQGVKTLQTSAQSGSLCSMYFRQSVHFIRSFYFFSGACSIPCILLEDLSFIIVATVFVSANLLHAQTAAWSGNRLLTETSNEEFCK